MSLQPTPDADATARQAKLAARIVVRRRFNEKLLHASQLLQQADEIAALGGLSDIEIQQARASGKLCGVNFYAITFAADADDFRRLDADLRHVATAVDPLILAIGEDAKANSRAISDADIRDHFKDVIFGAIDGNALFCLDEAREAAKQTADDIADAAADRAHDLQKAE